MLTDRPLATRHGCVLRGNPAAGLRHIEGGGKGPSSGKCRWCHGKIMIEHGLWGVFEWTGTGRYPGRLADATRLTEKAAQQLADQLNTDPDIDTSVGGKVVRWIPEHDLPPDELDEACEAYWANRPAGRDLRPVITIETRMA